MGGLNVEGRTARSRSRNNGTRALQRVFGVLAATGICFAAAPPALAGTAVPTRLTDSGAPDSARPGSASPDFGQSASTECVFGGDVIKSTPWSLQRILLDQLWAQATGKGVTVAVIDTGVDDTNAQLRGAMASGSKSYVGGSGTQDLEGHGTRVAGIIAARALKGTGFVGIAPDAKILSLRYTGGQEKQGNSQTMSEAIRDAVAQGAKIINISSDTANKEDNLQLRNAVAAAVNAGALIVAAAGNDGANGKSADTYPASYPGVLAVAASDRNDERAFFSQAGDFVDVAAPGVGMVSTVPKGGQCIADGTSFAAPYVAGVAALLKEKHPNWSAAQIATCIEETAQRPGRGPNRFIGWGVVDPVAALSDDSTPGTSPKPDPVVKAGPGAVIPMAVTMGESEAERQSRTAIYVLGTGLALVLVIAGSGVAVRDWRSKRVGTERGASDGLGSRVGRPARRLGR